MSAYRTAPSDLDVTKATGAALDAIGARLGIARVGGRWLPILGMWIGDRESDRAYRERIMLETWQRSEPCARALAILDAFGA
jgi:hypothetical protein